MSYCAMGCDKSLCQCGFDLVSVDYQFGGKIFYDDLDVIKPVLKKYYDNNVRVIMYSIIYNGKSTRNYIIFTEHRSDPDNRSKYPFENFLSMTLMGDDFPNPIIFKIKSSRRHPMMPYFLYGTNIDKLTHKFLDDAIRACKELKQENPISFSKRDLFGKRISTKDLYEINPNTHKQQCIDIIRKEFEARKKKEDDMNEIIFLKHCAEKNNDYITAKILEYIVVPNLKPGDF